MSIVNELAEASVSTPLKANVPAKKNKKHQSSREEFASVSGSKEREKVEDKKRKHKRNRDLDSMEACVDEGQGSSPSSASPNKRKKHKRDDDVNGEQAPKHHQADNGIAGAEVGEVLHKASLKPKKLKHSVTMATAADAEVRVHGQYQESLKKTKKHKHKHSK